MRDDRHARVESLFHAARAQPAEARGSFLAQACAGDEELRREVSELLAYGDPGDFLEHPPMLPPPERLPVGSRLGPYRIDEFVGAGGMGVVYRALDTRLGRVVALKTMSAKWRADPQLRGRFEREARAVAALNHPNICALHDIGRDGELDFLVMEYVDGEPLSVTLRRGPLSIESTVRIGREIASALAAAHGKDLVHRDIKPSNVILTRDGAVKLVDFGLARTLGTHPIDEAVGGDALTETGVILGTSWYMSPEQAVGQAIDARTDVFSLGIVLFECLAGRRPFDGETRTEYVRNLLAGVSRPLGELRPDAPAALQRVIAGCLDPNLATRTPSAKAVADALLAIPQDIPTWTRRWMYLAATLAVVAGLWSLVNWPPRPTAPFGTPELDQIVGWPEAEWNSRISPDRTRVSFLSDRGGATRIWIKKLNSNEEPRALDTRPGQIVGQTWSPDGHEIAYVAVEQAGNFLKIASTADPGPPRLAFHIEMAGSWDPARWIGDGVFLQRGPRLLRFDMRTKQLEDITAGWTVKPSSIDVRPDGRKVVYSAPSESHEDLWTANLDGSGTERLTNDTFTNRMPMWAGATAIVFASDRGGQADLWRMQLNDRSLQQLTFSGDREALESVAQDGSMLTFQQTHVGAELWEYRQDGVGGPVTADGRQYFWPSATSRMIAFQVVKPQHRGARFQMLDTDVALGMRDAGEFRMLLQREPDSFAPRLSPDGKWLAFLQWSPQRTVSNPMLLATALGSGIRRKITDDFLIPGYAVNAPFDPAGCGMVWARDGSALYFLARASSGVTEIRRFKVGSDEQPEVVVGGLRKGDVVFDIRLSTDGTRLAYNRWAAGTVEIRVHDLASAADETLWTGPAEKRFSLQIKGWRGDDAALILLRATQNSDDTSRAQLLALGIDRRLGPPIPAGERAYANGARWNPKDGRLYVTTVDGMTHNLSSVSMADGRVRPVTRNNLPGVTFSGIDVAGDGTLVYSREETKKDVWRISFRQ